MNAGTTSIAMADQDPADVLVPGSPCGHCGQPSSFRCAPPCEQSYCGKDCQKADRRRHKKKCPNRKERVIKPEIQIPMQAIVSDATSATFKADKALSGEKQPTGNTVIVVVFPDLDYEYTHKLYYSTGQQPCEEMIDLMLQLTFLDKGGSTYQTLAQHFGPDCFRQDLVAVVVRFERLIRNGVGYESLGPDPNNSDFVNLKQIYKSQPLGLTRLVVISYSELATNQMITNHIPLVLTGHRIEGSLVQAAMAEQALHGRECVICGEHKDHFTLSACNHAICLACGTKWRNESKQKAATCPLCRRPWELFDSIYPKTLQAVLQPNQFHRNRCGWCGAIAHYMCGCRRFVYCTLECKSAHGTAGHYGNCVNPWYLQESDRLGHSNGCLKWTSGTFVEQ
jgi:hypothetical protein